MNTWRGKKNKKKHLKRGLPRSDCSQAASVKTSSLEKTTSVQQIVWGPFHSVEPFFKNIRAL